MDKSFIYSFLNKHQIGVVSTLSPNGHPESAVVGFAETPELELIFGTSRNSRKANNIFSNPNVSFVIGWNDNITVQYQGKAQHLRGLEVVKYQEIHFTKAPSAKKYAEDPDEIYFLIKPTWIRYTDLNVYPWKIIEQSF